VSGREKLPNWERLWSDLVHEEIRRNTRDGTSSKGEDEEKFALVGKEKKGKGKKSQSKPESSQGGWDFFLCHEFGHYATNFPHKKERNNTSK